jgi:hypothetical protein
MTFEARTLRTAAPFGRRLLTPLAVALLAAACASAGPEAPAPAMDGGGAMRAGPMVEPVAEAGAPDPDPREGLAAGLFDAGVAIWNLELESATPPADDFVGVTNSDLAFKGPYAIQGNYNGFMVWDISAPAEPELVTEYLCPASQSDVSVYDDLLFVSGEGLGGRLDCGTGGVPDRVSEERLRGIRIFDISDIRNPEYIANVQTCRGSHTHSVLADPADPENVYIYVSGSAGVRPAEELPGCSAMDPDEDPNSALFRIEVIRVPLANPEAAQIVSSPRIFEGLTAPPRHGLSDADRAEIEEARARGAFIAELRGQERVLPDQFANQLLQQMVRQRGGSGAPTAADSASLRERLPMIIERMFAQDEEEDEMDGPEPGPTQCHDITLYPEIGLAGGACEGYGLLIDIEDPANPVRIDAVADSNFAYWHSATFNNDGTAVLFTDEWGGGGGPKCRAGDPYEWGANALFTIEDGAMVFQSYYKMPAVQTSEENCVAHNGSLIPVPGRDIMVQAWYQGGVSVFDWTDPANPVEIAFFDRGPTNAERMEMGGSWSAYWYDGVIVSSEIARGLDILSLEPSPFLTANEIEAAKTARYRLDHFNVQGQQQFDWPATFALARAYTDQLQRAGTLDAGRIDGIRRALMEAENASPPDRRRMLNPMADRLEQTAGMAPDADKVRMLAATVRELAG